MESSRGKDGKRSVFDVRRSEHRNVFARRTVNLRPKFWVRHPWGSSIILIAVAFAAAFGLRQLLVRAEVSDFYPASCLGTWQSPEKAQGEPESLGGAPIDASSAAQFADQSSQIFCGSFIPQGTQENGNIDSVGLTLVWNITGLPQMPTSTTDAASTSTMSVPTSTTTSTTSFITHFSPFALLFESAHAQTVDASDSTAVPSDNSSTMTSMDATPPPAPATTPAVATTVSTSTDASTTASTDTTIATDTSTSTVINTEPTSTAPTSTTADVPATTTATTTAPSDATGTVLGASTTTTISAIPLPDDNFLLISYSLDGSTWIPIQKVNPQNWQNLTIALPITQWSDLEKVQIKIEGIPTTLGAKPNVLLDGMFVEVHYDVPPVLSLTADITSNVVSSSPEVVQVSPNVTLQIPAATPTPFVPQPNIVGITKSSTTVSVTVQYVGDFYGGNPLYLHVYPQGTSAERNGADGAFSFAGVPSEGPSLDPIPVSGAQFDPVSKQAMITIVTPVPGNNQSIPTSAMTTGTYAVDLSYFDSATWHLIPAQTFTWP